MRLSRTQKINILCVIFFCVFGLTLSLIFLAPVRPDEILWLHISSRALYERFQMHHYYPTCLIQPWEIPWVFLPGRILVSLFHPTDLIQFRIITLLIYVSIIAVLSGIAVLINRSLNRLHVATLVTAFLSLGVFPFAMMNLRPEASIALGILLLFLFFMLARRLSSSGTKVLLVLAFLLVCSWLFSAHPKTVLFLPAIVIMAVCIQLGVKARILLTSMALIMAAQSFIMWEKNYVRCAGNRSLTAFHRIHAVLPRDIIRQPLYSFERMENNLSLTPERYLENHLFQDKYVFLRPKFLRDKNFPKEILGFTNSIIQIFIFGLFFLTVFAAGSIFYKKQSSAKIGAPVWVALAIGAGVCASMALKSFVHIYEVPFAWPLLLLVSGVILLSANMQSIRKYAAACVLLPIIIGIGSQAVMHMQLGGPIVQQSKETNKMRVRFAPVLGHANIEKTVRQAAAKCDIPLDKTGQNIVTDFFTYLTAQDTHRPITLSFLSYKSQFRNPLWLKELRNSSGILVRCGHLHPLIRQYSVRTRNICCISEKTLKEKILPGYAFP